MVDGSINHIGIATSSLDDSEPIWTALGFTSEDDQVVVDQGVKIRYMKGEGDVRIELLEPLTESSPLGRFLSRRGPGVQQIAVNVSNIEEKIEQLRSMGMRMVNNEPVPGSDGQRIAFVHPSSTGGVLVELVENFKR
tara:strand:+ start:2282 stop:2692 length:411 start_codon:yes stop_codon:yes gene_type:complete